MKWLNQVPTWKENGNTLSVPTGMGTDFWRVTFYDFVRETGHFYFDTITGDFRAGVSFSGEYKALYDQAGLMIRLNEENWIKARIESTDRKQHFSAAVPRGSSDWSLLPLSDNPSQVWLRLTWHVDTVRIQYSLNGEVYYLLRLAPFPAIGSSLVGMMYCSPKRAGFQAHFSDFLIGPPISKELHA
jgi:regulation of enolase protein 1 (concanavalin A-like superfamily)